MYLSISSLCRCEIMCIPFPRRAQVFFPLLPFLREKQQQQQNNHEATEIPLVGEDYVTTEDGRGSSNAIKCRRERDSPLKHFHLKVSSSEADIARRNSPVGAKKERTKLKKKIRQFFIIPNYRQF